MLRSIPSSAASRRPSPRAATRSRLTYGEQAVWVACGDGTVVRLDPATDRAGPAIPVGGLPRGIAAGEGAVWVTLNRWPDSAGAAGGPRAACPRSGRWRSSTGTRSACTTTRLHAGVYDPYLDRVGRMLRRGKGPDEIARYLGDVRMKAFKRESNETMDELFADRVVAWYALESPEA